jgi:hypothetical protein
MEREASCEIFCREEMMTYHSNGVVEGGQFAGWRSGNPIHQLAISFETWLVKRQSDHSFHSLSTEGTSGAVVPSSALESTAGPHPVL